MPHWRLQYVYSKAHPLYFTAFCAIISRYFRLSLWMPCNNSPQIRRRLLLVNGYTLPFLTITVYCPVLSQCSYIHRHQNSKIPTSSDHSHTAITTTSKHNLKYEPMATLLRQWARGYFERYNVLHVRANILAQRPRRFRISTLVDVLPPLPLISALFFSSKDVLFSRWKPIHRAFCYIARRCLSCTMIVPNSRL